MGSPKTSDIEGADKPAETTESSKSSDKPEEKSDADKPEDKPDDPPPPPPERPAASSTAKVQSASKKAARPSASVPSTRSDEGDNGAAVLAPVVVLVIIVAVYLMSHSRKGSVPTDKSNSTTSDVSGSQADTSLSSNISTSDTGASGSQSDVDMATDQGTSSDDQSAKPVDSSNEESSASHVSSTSYVEPTEFASQLTQEAVVEQKTTSAERIYSMDGQAPDFNGEFATSSSDIGGNATSYPVRMFTADSGPARTPDPTKISKRYGYQCSFGYDASENLPRLVPMNYCKIKYMKMMLGMFREGNWFIGKIITGDHVCYLIDNYEYAEARMPSSTTMFDVTLNLSVLDQVQELTSPATRVILTLNTDRFWFAPARKFREGLYPNCSTVPFTADKEFAIAADGTQYYLSNFVLGRTIVYSDVCRRSQKIPGLYSEELEACFYTEKDSPLLLSEKCEILCDSIPDTSDIWYSTNEVTSSWMPSWL